MDPETTKELVEAAQTGDKKAFEALVEQYFGMVHGLALSRVHDWNAADDLAQDVFLIAWSNLGRLRAPEAFLVWLRRIARNAALNWIRAQDYRRKLADRQRAQAGSQVPVEPDPSAAAARHECLEHIREALRTLSPKLREAMVLYYLEGHTAAVSAEMLGINVDTMKKRLRLGRAKMHHYYAERSVENLEQLLPHRPKRQIEQIMAGLAVGPVMPEWGAVMANPGPAIWTHHVLHAGSPVEACKAVAGACGNTLAGVGSSVFSVVAVVLGAAASTAILVVDPLGTEGANPVAVVAEEGMDSRSVRDERPVTAGVTIIDGLTAGRYLAVHRDIPAAEPGARGLRVGDRIISVNGRPVAGLIDAEGRGVLGGVAGAQVRVTYLPADNDTEYRSAKVVWPYDPNRFGESGAGTP